MSAPRPRPTRWPNRMVVALLRSRLHRAASGSLVEIRYRGRKTGRWYCLPAQYAERASSPRELVVYPGHPEHKLWWRSFSDGAPAVLLLRGRELTATGRVVAAADPQHERAVAAYRGRFPRVNVPDDAPLVVFTADDAS